MRFLALVLFAGCGLSNGFGGGDVHENNQDSDTNGAGDDPYSLSVAEDDQSCPDDTGSSGEQQLQLVGGDGFIDVVHRGVVGSCCAVWQVAVDPNADDKTLDVEYADMAEPCDCDCAWQVHYVLEDLEPGTWTVSAGTETEEATVE